MLFTRNTTVWVTRDGAPIGYFVSLGAYVALTLLTALLTWLFAIGWRAERRWFRRRAARPPIDDAIRERPDER